MTGATIGMCMQLKGCSSDERIDADPVAGGFQNESYDGLQLAWWTAAEWMSTIAFGMAAMVLKMLSWILFCMVQVAGISTTAVAMVYVCGGVLIWQHYWFLQRFALRNASWMMGFRWTWLIKPVVWFWCAWWLLRQEIRYLHARFHEAGQEGDMMVDIAQLYGGIDEYLAGGTYDVGAAAALLASPEPAAEMEAEPAAEVEAEQGDPEPFAGQDIAEAALQHVRLNGQHVDRDMGETEYDEMQD
eukprot:s2941_g17.t1